MSAADEVLNKGERVAGQGNSTSPSGQPVPSENTSITAGPQGPNVLNDIHLIEKLAHFNRERVPERTLTQRATALSANCTSPKMFPSSPRQSCSKRAPSPQ